MRLPTNCFLSQAAALVMLAVLPAFAFAQTSAPSPTTSSAPLTVVTTIKPIHALTSAVLGDVAKAELLIDGAASPHTYALKPSQVRRLNEASAVIMVSSELETFMDKIVASLPKTTKVVKLDQAPGILRLPVREGGLFEGHDHAHEQTKGAGGHSHHGHGHDQSGKTAAKSAGKAQRVPNERFDTHLWLDPRNAKTILTHLKNVLSDIRPEHRATFEANARAMAVRLDALQAEIARDLKPVTTKPFIVFHDAYQYFEQRFGLQAAGSITLNPEVQPGAKRIKALRARLQDGGAVCVFAEPQFEPKLVATLIEGTKVRRGSLDPIGVALAPGAGAYESLLRGLASDLRACLGGTS